MTNTHAQLINALLFFTSKFFWLIPIECTHQISSSNSSSFDIDVILATAYNFGKQNCDGKKLQERKVFPKYETNKQIDKERCVRREKLFIIWNSKQAIVEVPYDVSHTYNYIVKEHDKFHCTIYKNGKFFKNIQQVSGQSTLQLLSVIERWYSIFYELNGAHTDTL